MSNLPPRESVVPADLMAYALIDWARSEYVRCPMCGEAGLVGYLDHRPVSYVCQKCGPLMQKSPTCEVGRWVKTGCVGGS